MLGGLRAAGRGEALIGERDRWMQALQARLQRVSTTQDLSPVLEKEASAEARQLARTLTDNLDSLPAMHRLGWLHWYRYQALPEGHDQQDLQAAFTMFTSCFINGMTDLPSPLLPQLAEQATPTALRLLEWRNALSTRNCSQPHQASGAASSPPPPATTPAGPRSCPTSGSRCSPGSRAPGRRPTSTPRSRPGNRPCRPPPPTTPTVPGTCPTSGPRCGPGSSAPGRRRTWTPRSRRASRPCKPPPPTTPTAPGTCPTSGPRCASSSSAPGRRPTSTPRSRPRSRPCGHPRRPPRPRRMPVQPRDRAAHPVRAHRGAGRPGRRDPGRPASRASHPRRPPRPRRVPVQPRDRAAGPVRAHRGAGRPRRRDPGRQQAVQATPADHPDRAASCPTSGPRCGPGSGAPGQQADLDAAIQAGQQAVQPPPPTTPTAPGTCPTSGPRCGPGSSAPGQPADLDAAIAGRQQAVQATPADHPDRADVLSNLGIALRTRFERTGAAGRPGRRDPGRAQQAVQATPADHPDRAMYLSNLGAALRTRFERTGAQADLDAAIEAGSRPCRPPPPTTPTAPGTCPTSGSRCGPGSSAPGRRPTSTPPSRSASRPSRPPPPTTPTAPCTCPTSGRAARPVRAHRGAGRPGRRHPGRAAGRAGHPRRPPRPRRYLSNLGDALRTRFERTGAQADLDAAIEAGATGRRRPPPPTTPTAPCTCPTSATALRARFERTGAAVGTGTPRSEVHRGRQRGCGGGVGAYRCGPCWRVAGGGRRSRAGGRSAGGGGAATARGRTAVPGAG